MAFLRRTKNKRTAIQPAKIIANVEHQLLTKFVGTMLQLGVSVNFYTSKDRSVICINLWEAGEKEQYYCRSSKDMENVINKLLGLADEPEEQMLDPEDILDGIEW